MDRKKLQFEQLEDRSLMAVVAVSPGIHHEQIKLSPPSGSTISLAGVTMLAGEGPTINFNGPHITHGNDELSSGEKYPLVILGPGNVIVNGGRVIGVQPQDRLWSDYKRAFDGNGIGWNTSGPVTVNGLYVKRVEDGANPRGTAAAVWHINDTYFDQIRDDMVENDDVISGSISNSYMRGHTFLSERGGTVQDPHSVVTVNNTLVELYPQPSTGDHHINPSVPHDGLGNGSLFKWDPTSGRVNVSNSIFLVTRAPESSNSAADFPPGTYSNVTLVWLGPGNYPGKLPASGVTVTRDRSVFDRAVAKFFASHPQFNDVKPGAAPHNPS